ncbi:MAG: hypothetical protein M0R33_15485 [Methylomonas sp.]|jgi:hypothetical protein|uniref:hypothetical protein n=1 Tax=Methylomonas sp. TaxID=418 RepID=UPI0025EAE9BE|nr:hypothetical protein [Methylomonas sp.]MCK9607845.1 hypothetical protein [Methylomonas sp.]
MDNGYALGLIIIIIVLLYYLLRSKKEKFATLEEIAQAVEQSARSPDEYYLFRRLVGESALSRDNYAQLLDILHSKGKIAVEDIIAITGNK